MGGQKIKKKKKKNPDPSAPCSVFTESGSFLRFLPQIQPPSFPAGISIEHVYLSDCISTSIPFRNRRPELTSIAALSGHGGIIVVLFRVISSKRNPKAQPAGKCGAKQKRKEEKKVALNSLRGCGADPIRCVSQSTQIAHFLGRVARVLRRSGEFVTRIA